MAAPNNTRVVAVVPPPQRAKKPARGVVPPSQLATAAVPVVPPSATDTQAVPTLPAVARKRKVGSDRELSKQATLIGTAVPAIRSTEVPIQSKRTAIPSRRTELPANDIGLLETMIPTAAPEPGPDDFDIDLTESVEGLMPPLPPRRTIRAPAFDSLAVTHRQGPWFITSCVLAVVVLVLAAFALS